MENRKIQLELNWKTLWQVIMFLCLLVVLYLGRRGIGVLLIAIVISAGVDPIVSFLERKKINRLLGTVSLFFVGVMIVATAVYAVIPIVVSEFGNFLNDINKVISSLIGVGLPQSIIKDISGSVRDALGFLTAANISITGTISSVLSNIVLFFGTIIISFYLTIDKAGTEDLLRVILPDAYEESVVKIFGRCNKKIRKWFSAQIILGLIVGLVVTLGLWILGVKYFLILGLLAFIFELVPVIGPILVGAVAFLVTVPQGAMLALYTLIFFIIVQQLENHVLIPLVMGKTINLHPVVVITSILIGGQVAGFFGVVLSVPIAVLSQEIFVFLSEEKKFRKDSMLIK